MWRNADDIDNRRAPERTAPYGPYRTRSPKDSSCLHCIVATNRRLGARKCCGRFNVSELGSKRAVR
ncbi:hypothetical protein I545_3753 [Mycobacterium kansasii 662]|uniref:Uncharacterized protein n=2 Tax=Mycobacterium kansasii TaxID=1768 RepID=A0A1V3XEA4_MYCKA|nr:hypothetical protein I547_5461 [Mycobacterium kansasii 824]EUA17045.1 hypothetical protein I545_3753 [Mycobacterium kansasii 662]KEP41750.1 hypothetical protein MKSMC1_31150 [Mycobacterium kansasii]OOK77507.1 hypothetical protein BZL29_3723 [Mycobacterium kansasii]